jgi:AcrR family transcriptional regulator
MHMTSSETNEVRQRIIQASTSLFVSRGYTGISMREIAEAVGVSKAGLYYHFRDKEALFLAVLTANLEHIESLIRRACQTGPTVRDQISLMVRTIFEQTPQQRAIIRLASQDLPHINQAARDEFDRAYHEKFLGQIEDMLRDGMASGQVRPMDASLATWVLLGMMYPFFYPAHQRELQSIDEAIDSMLAIFFDGALTEEA